MDGKRTKLRIIIDILRELKYSKGGLKKTHIIYKSNITNTRFNEYIPSLLEKKFVVEKKRNGKKYYDITAEGEKFLQEIKKLKDISDAFGLHLF